MWVRIQRRFFGYRLYMPIVREPLPEDRAEGEEVDRLAAADLRRVYRPTEDAVRQRTPPEDFESLVAVVDGRVVGVSEYRIEAGQLSIRSLGVHPYWRRRGVARALIRHLETVALGRGARAMILYTVRETGNVNIFQRLGFKVESEEVSTLFEGVASPRVSEAFMTKSLCAEAPSGSRS